MIEVEAAGARGQIGGIVSGVEDEINAMRARDEAAARAEDEARERAREEFERVKSEMVALADEARQLLMATGHGPQPLHVEYWVDEPGSASGRLAPVVDSGHKGWGPLDVVEFWSGGEIETMTLKVPGGWFVTTSGYMVLVEATDPGPNVGRRPRLYRATRMSAYAGRDLRPRAFPRKPKWARWRAEVPVQEFQDECITRSIGPSAVDTCRSSLATTVRAWRGLKR